VDKFGKVVSSTDEKFVGKDFSGQDVFAQDIPKGYGETCVGQPQYSPDLDENCIFISGSLQLGRTSLSAGGARKN
jgi:hypothetical protein